jgi:hypothetical protein
MFEYLHPADQPVIDGLEKHEIIWAEDQPPYIPLRSLTSKNNERRVLSRWTLTPEQRKAVAEGGRHLLGTSHVRSPFTADHDGCIR